MLVARLLIDPDRVTTRSVVPLIEAGRLTLKLLAGRVGAVEVAAVVGAVLLAGGVAGGGVVAVGRGAGFGCGVGVEDRGEIALPLLPLEAGDGTGGGEVKLVLLLVVGGGVAGETLVTGGAVWLSRVRIIWAARVVLASNL